MGSHCGGLGCICGGFCGGRFGHTAGTEPKLDALLRCTSSGLWPGVCCCRPGGSDGCGNIVEGRRELEKLEGMDEPEAPRILRVVPGLNSSLVSRSLVDSSMPESSGIDPRELRGGHNEDEGGK